MLAWRRSPSLGELQPDLVLMDITLKGAMDGVEAAKAIGRSSDIPVIFMTAHSDDVTLQRAKMTGPFGYILKPLEERELHTTIEMALYKSVTDRRLRENERWLSTTLGSIEDAVITTDAAGIIRLVNPVAEMMTGWTKDEALGQNIAQRRAVWMSSTGMAITIQSSSCSSAATAVAPRSSNP